MNKIISLTLGIFICFSSYAQVSDTFDIQTNLVLKTIPIGVECISLGAEGLIMVYSFDKDSRIYITRYSADLEKIYDTSIDIANNLLLKIKKYKEKLYLLSTIEYKDMYGLIKIKDYNLAQFDYITQNVQQISGRFKRGRDIKDIVPYNEGVCVLSESDKESILVNVNFKRNITEELSLKYDKYSFFDDGVYNEEKQTLELLIGSMTKKYTYKKLLVSYALNSLGKTVKTHETYLNLQTEKVSHGKIKLKD